MSSVVSCPPATHTSYASASLKFLSLLRHPCPFWPVLFLLPEPPLSLLITFSSHCLTFPSGTSIHLSALAQGSPSPWSPPLYSSILSSLGNILYTHLFQHGSHCFVNILRLFPTRLWAPERKRPSHHWIFLHAYETKEVLDTYVLSKQKIPRSRQDTDTN